MDSATKRWLSILGLAAAAATIVVLVLVLAVADETEKRGEFLIPAGVPYINRSLECTSPLKLEYQDSRSFINLGQTTADKQYPWIAKIIITVGGYKSFCGGTIIDTRHILTAAHCFKPVAVYDNESFVTNPGAVKVYVGARRYLDDTWEFRQSGLAAEMEVADVYVHPTYNKTWNGMTDVAVIRLKTALQLSDHVVPVCLASEDDKVPDLCIGVGWGRDAQSELISHIQRQAFIKTYTKEDCINKFTKELRAQNYRGDINADLAGMLCTRSDEEYPGNTCQGDSGGPLLCEPRDSNSTALKQFGLTSFSFIQTCGPPSRINAYVSVALWRFWLQDFILPLLADEMHLDGNITNGTTEDGIQAGDGVLEANQRSGSGSSSGSKGSARRELGELTAGCYRIPSSSLVLLQYSMKLNTIRLVCPVVATVALCWKRRRPQPWLDCLALLPVQSRTANVAMDVRNVACHPFVLNCKS